MDKVTWHLRKYLLLIWPLGLEIPEALPTYSKPKLGEHTQEMSQGCLYHACSKSGEVKALGWGWIRTILCSYHLAFRLAKGPLLIGVEQAIQGDFVVLPQRAEVDHNILYLLVFQRDFKLKREEKPQVGQAPIQISYQNGQGLVSLALPFSLVLSTAIPSSTVPASRAQSPFLVANTSRNFSALPLLRCFPFKAWKKFVSLLQNPVQIWHHLSLQNLLCLILGSHLTSQCQLSHDRFEGGVHMSIILAQEGHIGLP